MIRLAIFAKSTLVCINAKSANLRFEAMCATVRWQIAVDTVHKCFCDHLARGDNAPQNAIFSSKRAKRINKNMLFVNFARLCGTNNEICGLQNVKLGDISRYLTSKVGFAHKSCHFDPFSRG